MPIRNYKERWVYPELQHVPGLFQARIGGSSLVARTLYQRGYTSIDLALGFLDPEHYHPSSPHELPGLVHAVDLIKNAIDNSEKILIWGDFDVDGQTSTTLLYSALSKIGGNLSYYIPIRSTESHGLSLPSLKDRIAQHQPSLILTCDTGIDAIIPINYARDIGINVVITDHHQLPPELPKANAVVNPNLLQPDHPLFNLPGVGVAYKVIEELYSHLDLNPSYLLDLVALGIVSDVATQKLDTRYLLQHGLEILRSSPRPGLQALYEIAGIESSTISEEQIGFVIGPRLNALGRLSDANPSVEFLTTTNLPRAKELALLLENLNQRRQDLTEQIYNESVSIVEQNPFLVEDFPVLVLDGPPSWEPGVIGIVASRLVDLFKIPVIMLSSDGDTARGSARSVPGVPISDLISSSSDLLISFGGHPMAAGLSLLSENISKFRRLLSDNFIRVAGELPEEHLVNIDAEIPFRDANFDLIADILRLSPFGAGNPKLLFSTRGVSLKKCQIIGREKSHRKLTLTDPEGTNLDILWWNSASIPLPEPPFDVAYNLDITLYKNQPQIQSTLQHIRRSSLSPVYYHKSTLSDLTDFRNIPAPEKKLASFLKSHSGVVWAEQCYPAGQTSYKRSGLVEAPALIIWTIPPSRLVLNQAVSRVSPSEILFFSVDPSFSSLQEFLTSLLGLLKHLDRTNKDYDPEKFSESLAVPVDLIEVGLEWINLHGDFDLSLLRSSGVIKSGAGSNQAGFELIDSKLKGLLREISYYRNYYKYAPIRSLL